MSRLLNTAEAAEYLHLHPETVREKCRAGELPTVRVGHKWLIAVDEIRPSRPRPMRPRTRTGQFSELVRGMDSRTAST